MHVLYGKIVFKHTVTYTGKYSQVLCTPVVNISQYNCINYRQCIYNYIITLVAYNYSVMYIHDIMYIIIMKILRV